MKSDRLWPVLLVLATLLTGVGILEWVAGNREEKVETIRVVDSAGAELEGETQEGPWQATEPSNPEHARARSLMRRGELDEALSIYQTLVATTSDSTALLAEYAYTLRQARRCDEALAVVEQALLQAPNDGAVNLSNALTLHCLGNEEQARVAFERAVELRPNHHPTRLSYGEFLAQSGDLDRAIAVLEPAARSGDNDERAQGLAAFGRALFERGNRAPARLALQEAVERAPARVAIWMAVARTYLLSSDSSDHEQALAHALQASRLAPELATAHSALGRAYEKLGRNQEAIEAYRRAAELDRNYKYVRNRLVRLAIDEEEYQLANDVAAELLEIDPEDAEYQFLHGQAAALNGNLDDSRASYTEAIRLRTGNYPEAWYQLGLLERDAGQNEAAEAAFQQAVTFRENYKQAWNELGLVHFDQERYDDAESDFRRAIELDNDFATAWSNLGRTLAARDDYAAAAEAYQQALRIEPRDRVNRLRLAAAFRRTDRAPQAIELYRALVNDEPLYVSAWYNFGIALAADNRDEEARTAYLKAIQIDPDHANSIKNLGLLEARMGLYPQALLHLTDALDREPADNSLRMRVAELSRQVGDYEGCLREVGVLLSQDPELSQATVLQQQCTAGE